MTDFDKIFPLGSVSDPQWITSDQLITRLGQFDRIHRTDPVTRGVSVARGPTAAYGFGISEGFENLQRPLSDQEIVAVQARFSGNPYVYGAYRQPAWDDVEKQLAYLRGGDNALAVADGRRSISLLMSTLPRGAHVIVAPEEVYSGTYKMFMQTLRHSQGLEVSYVNDISEETLSNAVRANTAMIFSEVYTNPRLNVADLEVIASVARENNILSVVDNTVSPLLVRPLANGIDIELGSLTKYESSQNDILGGLIVASSDPESLMKRPNDLLRLLRVEDEELRKGIESAGLLNYWRNVEGGTMSTDVANEFYNRLTNLPPHMRKVSQNGMEMARWLQEQDGIERVYYPGLETHPGHEIATKFARAHGGLVTFVTKGDCKDAIEFAVAVDHAGITYFDSFGGTRPNMVLVCEQTSRYRAMSPQSLKEIGMSPGLNRLNVGSGDLEFNKEAILAGLAAIFRRQSFPAAVVPRSQDAGLNGSTAHFVPAGAGGG